MIINYSWPPELRLVYNALCPRDAPKRPTSIPRYYGTWDFKWPMGQVIKVAFQKPVVKEGFEDAVCTFKEKVALWMAGDGKGKGPNLSIEWVEQALPAPEDPTRAESAFGEAHVKVDYDVLVSFAPLPVTLPKMNRKGQDENSVVAVQGSELGRFSLRIDYGTPTIFVGPDNGDTLAQWVKGENFVAATVHEFGHTLGIPHMHQNPLYRTGAGERALKSEKEIVKIIHKILPGRKFPEEEVPREVMRSWPNSGIVSEKNGKRSVMFSDWMEMPEHSNLAEVTAMIHPGWHLFLEGVPFDHDAPAPQIKEASEPLPYDLRMIEHMYPFKRRH